jgi:penicillin-binding protein 1C
VVTVLKFLKKYQRWLQAAAFLALCPVTVWWVLPWCVDLPAALLLPRVESTRYTARDGSPLRQLLTVEGDRVGAGVPFEAVPQNLILATLAAEDRRFWSHGGVDLLAIVRAARDNAKSGRIVSGASTIHQQLIKVSARREGKRTLWVKFVEALQARRLSLSWPKERVLSEYLSRISYGNLLTGCQSAASGYFNKPLSDLTLNECALLAAVPQSPSRYNPFKSLEPIRPRQMRILHAMHDQGWISEAALRVALDEKTTLQRFTGGFAAPHAIEMLRTELQERAPEVMQTTIDPMLQQQVERIISGRLLVLKDRHVTQGAAVVIENATGHVLALAGSRDFFSPEGGQINGAWAPHSPGSAMKPFTYQLAFERGATPASIVGDLPIEYPTPTGTYKPENYAHRLYGPMTYRDALGNSLNISAVKVLASVGGAETLLSRMQELGLTTLTEPAEHYGLGLTIGNAPVRLIELTNAYAALARLGEWKTWSLTQSTKATSGHVFAKQPAYLIADILSDNQARTLTFGANSPLRLPFQAAVKTGTSQSYRDNWTLGYTPEFTVGVWVGNFDNTPMQEVSGVTGAAPIWRDIFMHLHQRNPQSWYDVPSGMARARIDPRTGKRLTSQSPPARVSREDLFIEDQLPAPAITSDYDERGRAFIQPEYAAWLRSAENWMGDVVICRSESPVNPSWAISNPIPGTVIHLDPDLPNRGSRLLLQTQPSMPIEWSSESLSIEHDGNLPFVRLTPGRHKLTGRHSSTGDVQSTFVIVHDQ